MKFINNNIAISSSHSHTKSNKIIHFVSPTLMQRKTFYDLRKQIHFEYHKVIGIRLFKFTDLLLTRECQFTLQRKSKNTHTHTLTKIVMKKLASPISPKALNYLILYLSLLLLFLNISWKSHALNCQAREHNVLSRKQQQSISTTIDGTIFRSFFSSSNANIEENYLFYYFFQKA